jgi:hypothetical protein
VARFESLPHAVQVHIFDMLPISMRLRCTGVCRAWRLALRDPAAWRHVAVPDFEFTEVNSYDVFGAVVAWSQGQLETLDLSNVEVSNKSFLDDILFASESGVQPQLRELRLGPLDFRDSDEILHILEKAPQLQLLAVASKWSHCYDPVAKCFAHELYRGAVRIRTLGLDLELTGMGDVEQQALFTRIRNLVGQLTYPDFTALHIDFDVLNDTILDFLAELAESHEPALCLLGLKQFEDWPGVNLRTTVRLLRLDAVRHFASNFWANHLTHDDDSIDPEIWTEICAAVSGCTSLHTVLVDPRLAHMSARASRQFTAALAGHPSIARIQLDDEEEVDYDEGPWPVWVRVCCSHEYGRGIAEIIAANAPALRRMYVCDAALEEDGMNLLVDVLPRNTHLRQLFFGTSVRFIANIDDPTPSRSFWRRDYIKDRFIPALRRNRGLRQLSIDEDGSDYVEYTAKDMEEVDIDDCDEDDLVCMALQEAVLLVRERSDPKVLAAARAGARDWQRAYRRWTTQP